MHLVQACNHASNNLALQAADKLPAFCQTSCRSCSFLQASRGQVAALKASRDRLLMELDRQQVELDRLANEAAQASGVGCLSGAR